MLRERHFQSKASIKSLLDQRRGHSLEVGGQGIRERTRPLTPFKLGATFLCSSLKKTRGRGVFDLLSQSILLARKINWQLTVNI